MPNNNNSKNKNKPMTYDEYMNRRSWLIDTAETPKQQKVLKEQLKELKKQYQASRRQGGITTPNGASNVNPIYLNYSK
jgi:hypothetical protein